MLDGKRAVDGWIRANLSFEYKAFRKLNSSVMRMRMLLLLPSGVVRFGSVLVVDCLGDQRGVSVSKREWE